MTTRLSCRRQLRAVADGSVPAEVSNGLSTISVAHLLGTSGGLSANIPLNDREWIAADQAAKVCVSYHDVATFNIDVDCSFDAAATFNYTSYVAAALLFVALTIPLARFTDWLVARDRRRRQATGT